jgi:hypothetical protein
VAADGSGNSMARESGCLFLLRVEERLLGEERDMQ